MTKISDCIEYPIDDRISIRFILNYVEANKNTYKSIYPDLLALSANLYPELFDITSFLLQEGKESESEALWDIQTINKDWIQNLPAIELKPLLDQWQTNPSLVVQGSLYIIYQVENTKIYMYE